MATKRSKVVTYYQKLQPIKSHNPLDTWSREVTRGYVINLKHFISTTTVFMATKPGRAVHAVSFYKVT